MSRLSEILNRIEYRPGWSFDIDGDQFLITAPLIDSRTRLPKTLTFGWPMEDYFGCESAESFLYECLRQVAFHEVGEWLVIDGVRYYDPHDPAAWARAGKTMPDPPKGGAIAS
jgi:hypothetical protein